MIDAISKLVESGAISEDTQKSIQEAWDLKVKENRETVGAELREEFAKRYEHDKSNMIEAIDSMMNEKLSEEITKFVEDRKALAQEKIAYKENVGKHSAKLESFILSKLSEELKELHSDRKGVHENFTKLEEFVVNALAKEIKEFHEDKKGVVETKVKLVAEAKKQMAKMKEAFIKKSAKVVENAVVKKLGEELTQLKEDITKARNVNFGKKIFEAFASEYQNSYLNEKSETAKLMKVVDETALKLAEELKSLKEDITAAREVNFGKKIFEAFASEYQNSYLNEKSETAKLMKVVDETTLKLKDAEKAVEEKKAVIESKEAEAKRQSDLMERKEKMAEMLKPLGKTKGEVMAQLLESVQTDKLQASFDKYLPHVMAEKPVASTKQVISEAKGDRAVREDAELTNIRKLAGI